MRKSKFFGKAKLNKSGFSLVEFLVAGGLLAMITAAVGTLMIQQNQQVKYISQKIVINDTKNALLASMLNPLACKRNLDSTVDSSLVFDSTAQGVKAINLTRLRAGPDPASPIILEKDKEIGSGSRIFVYSIKLDELRDEGGGTWSGTWKVDIRDNFTGFIFKPITLTPQIFDVNIANPRAAKVTGCHTIAGGGDSLWDTSNGIDIYYNGGMVGVGTANPVSRFQVTARETPGWIAPPSRADGITIQASAMNKIAPALYFNDHLGNYQGQIGTSQVLGDFQTPQIGDLGVISGNGISLSTGPLGTDLYVAPDGKVGIGTITPDVALSVVVNATGVVAKFRNTNVTGYSEIEFWDYLNNRTGTIGYANPNAPDWQAGMFYVGPENFIDMGFQTNALERIRITASGEVGIGTKTPQTTLQVAGIISPAVDNTTTLGSATYRFTTVYATNGTINTSDRREKKDIANTDLGLDFINKLRPVSYRWNTGIDNDVHYGLIAQEAEQVINDVGNGEKTSIVTHDETTDRYGVRYSELISPLIKALQELYIKFLGVDREIASVKAEKADKTEVEQLKIENAELKARLDKLEKTFNSK